jgi:hypothetical protein
MRTAYGITCASVAMLFVAVQVLRFGFGSPMGTQAVFMLLVLTVVFLVASALLHHPTYDDVGPTAAITLTTGIAVGLLTFFFVLRGREAPTLPAYVALGVYAIGFTAVGVLLFVWRKSRGLLSRAGASVEPPVGHDAFVRNGGQAGGQSSSSRTVEELVALRRKTHVHRPAADERADGGDY